MNEVLRRFFWVLAAVVSLSPACRGPSRLQVDKTKRPPQLADGPSRPQLAEHERPLVVRVGNGEFVASVHQQAVADDAGWENYVAEEKLVVTSVLGQEQQFDLHTTGPNYHTCDSMGRIRYAEDEQAILFVPDDSFSFSACAFVAVCRGTKLVFTHDEPAGCERDHCGARAAIVGHEFDACSE